MNGESHCRLPEDEVAFRLEELASAYAQPELAVFGQAAGAVEEESAEQAAAVLAQCLGYCRLFGIPAGDLDGVLPARAAMAASRELRRQAQATGTRLADLPTDYFEAADPLEGEAACDAILNWSMETWAATVAISEAYQRCLEEDDEATQREFSAELDRLNEKLEVFDVEAVQYADLLSVAAESYLLENWRAMLVEPYNLMLPWWLDGTLERAAQEVDRSAEIAPTPSPGAGNRMPRPAAGPERKLTRSDIPPVHISAAGDRTLHSGSYIWRSPEGDFTALITLTLPWPDDATPVTLAFDRWSDEEPAVELAGRTVTLGAASATINAEADAVFTAGDIRDQPAVLDVEGFDQPWTLTGIGDPPHEAEE